MEYFVTGATLSLLGVFALTAIAYKKGWLKRAAKQLANEAENRSRQRILDFIQSREALRNLVAESNQAGQQLISQLTSDLKALSVRESRELAEEIFRLGVDFQGTAGELVAVCEEILQSEDEPRTRVFNPEPEAPRPSAAPTKLFDDAKQYGYYDQTTRGSWLMCTGRDLNQRMADGEVPLRDFFVLPEELCGLQ